MAVAISNNLRHLVDNRGQLIRSILRLFEGLIGAKGIES